MSFNEGQEAKALRSYLKAIAAATAGITFQVVAIGWLKEGSPPPANLVILCFIYFFFFFIIATIAPYSIAYLIFLRSALRSIYYWLGAWAVIAAFWVGLFVSFRPSWFMNIDSDPPFTFERAATVFLAFVFPSLCAAIVCWVPVREHRTRRAR
jgi:hypothetical protein